MQTIRLFHIDLLWRYGWLKNPAIWLAMNILTYILEIYPYMEFEQEHNR